mgnify:CR=1 FL=1
MELTAESLIAKLPDFYDKSANSNNVKILEVIAEAMQDALDALQSVLDLTNLENATGINLDRFGRNYGVLRNGLTDDELRTLINAKRAGGAGGAGGNSVNTILNWIKLYVPNSTPHLVELWSPVATYFLDGTRDLDDSWTLSSLQIGIFLDGSLLLDGSYDLSGIPLSSYRGFYIQADGLSTEQQAAIRKVLPVLKAGGVYGVLNG